MSTEAINTVDEVIKIFEKDIPSKSQKIEQQDIKEDIPQEELIANAFTGDKIKELLSSTGPTVKAVLLKTDGSMQEVLYDSTPSKNHVTEILCGPPTIIGQYVDLDVIVVGQRYDVSPSELPLNKNKLRYPFNNNSFTGNIFLYRFSQDCVMEDFTLEEYKEFISKSNEDIGKVFKPVAENDTQEDEQVEEITEEEANEQYEFMRNVILKKVKQDFPAKFGREPTEEELENYVNATMAMAGFGCDEIYEEDEEDDADYDPTQEDDDMKQAIADEMEDMAGDDELENDAKDIEMVHNEYKMPLKDVNEAEEEKAINSEAFEAELKEAIENVRHIAKLDKEKILLMAREEYMKDTGEEPDDDMLANAFKMFANDEPEVEQDDNEVIGQEHIDEALECVTNLGKVHRQEFIEKISNTYMELNGEKPSDEQVNKILNGIKESFAEEAMDEFMEKNECESGDGVDEDYNPEAESELKQVEDDKKIDVMEELLDDEETQNEDNDTGSEKVKIWGTPVKKGRSGSRMGIYLEESDEKKTLPIAEAKFEQINGRKPTEDDKERLKEFLKTGMLFESEVEADNNVMDDKEKELKEEEEDEDYVPENDTFDYSKDVEADKEFEIEFEKQNENNDTSNVVETN